MQSQMRGKALQRRKDSSLEKQSMKKQSMGKGLPGRYRV